MVKKTKYSISSYTKFPFEGPLSREFVKAFNVYEKGDGPPIIIIQELPGIGQETLRLADKLIQGGFKVFLPHLFGPLERTSMLGNLLRVFCMRREFHIFATKRSSPIVNWLRALANFIKNREKAAGVGVIGMCLTGNFAISMMADDAVLASVASQPSLPVIRKAALHMSDSDIAQIKNRLERHGPILAYRFEKDFLCTGKKFKHFDEVFNEDKKTRIKLNMLPGFGHSVLTLDFVEKDSNHPTQQALREVIRYFQEKLI